MGRRRKQRSHWYTYRLSSGPLQYGNKDDARATGAQQEDAKLTNVATNNSKNRWGKESRTDWAAATVLVPGQTLHSSIDRASERPGKWAEDEDIKLKNAVQTHGGKNWAAIAALVPGRKKKQCSSRWHDYLDPNIDRTIGRMGKWAEDEDIKLKDFVQTHGGKNWVAIASLVPGRSKKQCHYRWKDALNPSIDRANGRTGKW